jgi:hypothetical protein
MHCKTRIAGLCLLGLLVAGCAAPSSAPAPAPTGQPTRPAAASAGPGSPAPSSASPSASASAPPSPSAASIATEQPVAAEISPAGDIPDNQVFVVFASPSGGYQLQVPEGWARTDNGTDVRFVSKLDGVQVAVVSASTPPTVASAQAAQVADLQRSGRAVQVTGVQQVQLPSGAAIQVDYASNSDPDPVTGKQVRPRRLPVE